MSDCLLKLCAHRAADGTKCKAPARRESDYCRHHVRVHRPPVIFPAYIDQARTAPQLEAAIYRTMTDMLHGTITSKYGGQILFELSKSVRSLAKTASNPAAAKSLVSNYNP